MSPPCSSAQTPASAPIASSALRLGWAPKFQRARSEPLRAIFPQISSVQAVKVGYRQLSEVVGLVGGGKSEELPGRQEGAGQKPAGLDSDVVELLSCPNGPVSGKSTAQLQKPPSLRKQTRFPSEMGISSRRGSLAICRQRGLLLPCYKNTPNE